MEKQELFRLAGEIKSSLFGHMDKLRDAIPQTMLCEDNLYSRFQTSNDILCILFSLLYNQEELPVFITALEKIDMNHVVEKIATSKVGYLFYKQDSPTTNNSTVQNNSAVQNNNPQDLQKIFDLASKIKGYLPDIDKFEYGLYSLLNDKWWIISTSKEPIKEILKILYDKNSLYAFMIFLHDNNYKRAINMINDSNVSHFFILPEKQVNPQSHTVPQNFKSEYNNDVDTPIDETECSVCMNNKKSHAYIPCGHRFCGECAAICKNLCPHCRKVPTGILKTY